MSKSDKNLTRPIHLIPEFIEVALGKSGLIADYKARPAYQRNDYIGWIVSAKQPQTRQKRLDQMLAELRIGGVYMKMKHPPSRKES